MTRRVLDALAELGAATPNRSGLPIIEVPLADHTQIDEVGRFLFERGIYVTLAAYPLVPQDEVGFRVQVTAANTDAEISRLIEVIGDLSERYALQPAADESGAERAA
jgi:8-amino-7-oxononanoate synthase